MTTSSTLGTPGVRLTPRSEAELVDGLRRGIDRRFGPCVEHFVAPPVIDRRVVELVGYPESFPQLLGSVYGAPQGGPVAATDLVLTAAACHHLYPVFADRALASPVVASVEAACYRGEATSETGRLRSFRMYEVVCLGPAGAVEEWRDRTLTGAAGWLRELGLGINVVAANDPFFGRTGVLLASTQRSQGLKSEFTAEVDDGLVQAIASVNYHKEHFGEVFGIADADAGTAHSSCLAFGLDRVVLALRRRHGDDVSGWPPEVRSLLS
ncbi:hypothetical protein [Cryptosporangium arvum]|uniref:Seryl-tRNA synthetase n=1 Tax=Cryptosporangium arvum DSM 44712 TaxID=927661 RepID=A0A010ZTU4_9ACTN|nr:hypothetical protein [Cryptosporangium arvum]EXG82124.1 hypothetical protein CryarDRAFT_3266 [Cryptosporangium arvum DSM 44712]